MTGSIRSAVVFVSTKRDIGKKHMVGKNCGFSLTGGNGNGIISLTLSDLAKFLLAVPMSLFPAFL